MNNKTSERLSAKSKEIMDTWEERTLREIKAAHLQESLALRNSLPVYLTQIVDALSTTIDRTSARKRFDKEASTRIGQKHGRERAGSVNYTMDQMILEYHILRQVIFDVMEKEKPLSEVETEVIICSIEQAVNDAATEFSDTLRNIQEQLSQTLAHDLRTPITAAKLNAEIIMKKTEDDSFLHEKAHRICQNMVRVDRMITDLLDVSKLRAGEGLTLEFHRFDLSLIIQSVGDELNIENRTKVITHFPNECYGNWNADGLRRMIENLANNAIKYGSKNDPVTLSLSQDENKVIIKVHNFGEPIPEKEQSVLFEQYRRGRSSENKIGWGLGLTVVKGMVDSHNGTINVTSSKEQGTTFTAEIPKVHQKT